MTSRAIMIVTGGNRGLGRATALELAKSEVDVILTYRSNKDEAEEVVETLQELGREAVALRLDTTEFHSFPAFAESVRYELGARWDRAAFDFLVNNAGSAAATPVGEVTEEAFDLMVDVHLKGVVFLTQALLPLLSDGGRIVNLSSTVTRKVTDNVSIYAATKAAIDTYSLYLAKELGPRGISVNTIAPGPIATDFGGGVMRDHQELRAFLAGNAALGRVGEPEDIGAAVAALLGPGTGWITGQRIEVSGGTLL